MRLQAISPQFSAFVSASAGTGKTKTLIDRLINLLLADIKPSKILCLAFTKAAAAEILSRISQKLSFFTMASSEALAQELQELGFNQINTQLELKARILFSQFLDETEPLKVQTIHAFCQQLLIQFPLEAGININFSLLSENKLGSLIDLAKNKLLSSINDYPYASEALHYLSWHMKEYSLKGLLFEIIASREKLDNYFAKSQNLKDFIKDAPDEERFIRSFIASIPLSLEKIQPIFAAAKTDLARAIKLEHYFSLTDPLKIMLIEDYFRCFLTLEGERIKIIATKKIREEFPELFIELTDEQARVYQFSQDLKLIKTTKMTNSFIILSYYIRQLYADIKQQNNYLDYDDLIKLANELLSNSQYAEWIRYKLDGGIDHILLDEAQDTSFNQWQIINKISEEFLAQNEQARSIFIVGDAKQSIFSFQGADPALFNSMNEQLPPEVVRLSLIKSFRSGSAILELVDRIFNQDLIKALVSPIEPVIEHLSAKELLATVEVWPLILDEELAEIMPWALPSDFIDQVAQTGEEQLASKISDYIKAELKNGNLNNAGEVMIITRRRTKLVNHLISALKEADIPVAGLDRLQLMQHPAILDLRALINFILCPADDFNLAILLKSPICAMQDKQLMELCYNRSASLWQALGDKIFLQDLLKLSNEQTIFEFFFYLLEHQGVRDAFIDEFGSEVNDVLDAFLDLISQFERENIPSMQLFLDFLGNTNSQIKRDLSHASGQVRIMTVHGAKGLQAKMVIIADTTSMPTSQERIIWLDNGGLLYPGREKYYPDSANEAVASKYTKDYAEYLRLLYVALTRAEERLIICGSAKDEKISERCWYSIVNQAI